MKAIKKRTHEADKVTRRKARISFQLCGREKLKFCKAVLLTDKFLEILGRSARKIVPREVKDIENGVPVISIFRDDENRQLVLRCDRVKRFDVLTQDEQG